MNETPKEQNRHDLQAECDRLRRKIRELEAESRRKEELLALASMERDGYLGLLQMLVPRSMRDEDWQRILRENDCKALDHFLGELETIVC